MSPKKAVVPETVVPETVILQYLGRKKIKELVIQGVVYTVENNCIQVPKSIALGFLKDGNTRGFRKV